MDALLTQLGALPPAAKGRAFERLTRWYLENAPAYRRKLRRVYLWDEWPDRWGPESGIDLVAETRTGELWAVQAKAYEPAYYIKKADMDSFIAESSRPQFAYRLLVATTDRLGPRADRTLRDLRVGMKLLSELRAEDIDWPGDLESLEPIRQARKEPRPHQLEAIANVVDGFAETDRGQLLMACGTGKTLTALWIDERLEGNRTLIFTPSLSLLGQTLRVWAAEAERDFEYLAVCSDQTVAAVDDFAVYASDLGVPVTTNSREVAAFLRRRGQRLVVFATYQSSAVVIEAQSDPTVPGFDLAIADEAHRCAGAASSPFGAVLDGERLRASKRLFMTATPRYLSQRVEGAATAIEVASMDDERAFGAVLHGLSFGEAIRRELLADYRVLVIGVDDPRYATYANAAELVSRDGTEVIDAGVLARQLGLLRAMDRFDLRRVVTFHGRVKAARDFAEALLETVDWMPEDVRPKGTIWARHVAGTMNAGQREALLDRLRTVADGERAVLANVRCLAEGVDVPALDGIAFIDPRRSAVEIVQAVGRAIRPSPDKSLGTIVIPVFIPPETNDQDALDSSAFRPVWEVVRALRAHDELLAETLDQARYRLGRGNGEAPLPAKLLLDVPRTLTADFARAFRAKLVEQTTSPWEFWFGLLERYAAREGSVLDMPRAHVEDSYPLGEWALTQRMYWRQGRHITPERIERLETVPGWVWSKWEDRWERGFNALRTYVQREGTAVVPEDHVEDGIRLGKWVTNQRRHYLIRDFKPERAQRLEALPGWAWAVHDARWERRFAALVRYAARTGHVSLPNDHVEEGVPLSGWVTRQRKAQAEGRLSKDRVERLETVPGWRWRGQPDHPIGPESRGG